MPSFDIVSEVSSMEIENAVNQAKKELASRFDFKGSNAEIVLEKNEIKLSAGDMVPADVRLLESRDLFVSQSALTGEAMPAERPAPSAT